MDNQNNFLVNTSVLYRNSLKYYDKQAMQYGFGYGQLLFLILIYENEGISMQALAQKGNFDKGTITKSIQKLEELGLVEIVSGSDDKRVKLLYTTSKVEEFIADIYVLRQSWWEQLTSGLSDDELAVFSSAYQKIVANAIKYEEKEELANSFKVYGFNKTTLLDYPGKLACTIFSGGCNLRCPYCQNSSLVFMPENMQRIDTDDILEYLAKRANLLEGVCISGGEPTLHEGLESFIREVKKLGLKVKLDTNGFNPDKLIHLCEEGLIDYVAIDIKNCKEAYSETVGINPLELAPLEKTVKYLMNGEIDYEFRTTMVKEFHTKERMQKILKWIGGAKAYYLQNFVDRDSCIQQGLHGFEKEELEEFADMARKCISKVEIRGV